MYLKIRGGVISSCVQPPDALFEHRWKSHTRQRSAGYASGTFAASAVEENSTSTPEAGPFGRAEWLDPIAMCVEGLILRGKPAIGRLRKRLCLRFDLSNRSDCGVQFTL